MVSAATFITHSLPVLLQRRKNLPTTHKAQSAPENHCEVPLPLEQTWDDTIVPIESNNEYNCVLYNGATPELQGQTPNNEEIHLRDGVLLSIYVGIHTCELLP